MHGDDLNVWIRAIQWEYIENYNVERVKSLLSRAQQRHPNAQQLYTIAVRIELENKSRLDVAEAFRGAEAAYMNSRMQKFTNAEFYAEMYELVDKYRYAHAIQQHILNDMQEICPHAEVRWHILAQRELNAALQEIFLIKMECEDAAEENENGEAGDSNAGATNSKTNGMDMGIDLKNVKVEDYTKPQRIEACINIYEDAIKDVI